MAKVREDLEKSRLAREEIARQFGGLIPESILKYDRSRKAIDLLVSEEGGRAYTATGDGVWRLELAKKAKTVEETIAAAEAMREYDDYMLSGAGARWGALSLFPQNVGEILLKLYTKIGDTVVDPFAGHNSRMELCWRNGRNYIGHDISHRFMEANFKVRDMLIAENEGLLFPNESCATITLCECDSRQMPTRNNAGDFTITSPPYWDLEYYGPEMGQLGKDNEYPEFLNRLGDVAKENFRCLKSGSFCVWCVNDFRKDGKFYNYHGDTIRLLRHAGFKQHDIAITDLGTSMRAAFATQIVSQKILPKRHEYALIFVKP